MWVSSIPGKEMEGCSRNSENCPQLLDLIPNDREWLVRRVDRSSRVSEEKKLELKLGPPGEDWFTEGKNKNNSRGDTDESLLSLRCFSSMVSNSHNNNNSNTNGNNQNQKLPWSSGSSSQSPSPTFLAKTQQQQQQQQQQPNNSQKRTAPAPAPVVGWPPIRSFRKNLASSSSSKPSLESQEIVPTKVTNAKPESCKKGLFVKINMDGVPIGRKVDLKAYDSYEKLSSAVDELFRALLAAQRDSSAGGNHNSEEARAITGLLNGSGEYTLVYEDNEGDRMLVGDVPWQMFVGTVKRLRVLKSSELSAFCLGSSKQEKTPLDPGVK